MSDVVHFFTSGFQSLERISTSLPLLAVVLLFCLVATYTDIATMKIPNKLNALFAVTTTVLFAILPLINGDWRFALNSLLGGVAGFILLLIPAVVTGFKMAGDIKFIGAFGIAIGIQGIVPFLLLASALNLGTNGILIAFKKSNMKKTIPFAPFFLAAFLITLTGIWKGWF